MNILVVNDDGFKSEGIKLLRDAFKKYGDVYVVAPYTEKSGASASITSHLGIEVKEQGDQIWSVDGTPSDCVKYGLFGLNIEADLVVSGINNGPNIGIDTIYSGTIGAAMESLFHGKKSIAFSADFDSYKLPRNEISHVIDFILSNDLLSDEYILNVNFPKKSFQNSSGISVTDLNINQFEHGFIQRDEKYYGTRKPVKEEYEEHTDLYAFYNGVISITPLKLGNGDGQLSEQLRKRIQNK